MTVRLTRSALERIAAAFVPRISRGFFEMVETMRGSFRMGSIGAAVAEGDPEQVAILLGIGVAQAPLLEAIRSAYDGAGREVAGRVPRRALPRTGPAFFQFNIRNPRAERWLLEQSSDRITGSVAGRLSAAQRDAVRVVMSEAFAQGRGVQATARDIVGRVGPGGTRVGGVIGLNGPQAQWVMNARAELASGDPATMARYFTRKRRDRRLDGFVQGAIDAGRSMAAADVDRLVDRYSNRLLMLRGETVARTEALSATAAAQDETWRQAVEAGIVNSETTRKTWRSPGDDGRTREDHLLPADQGGLDGQSVPLDEPFVAPDGSQLMYPRDASLGAAASQVISCRCWAEYDVDFIEQAARS